jgi:hypothetical protein
MTLTFFAATATGTTETKPLASYPVSRNLEFHPLADLFPMMTQAEADELKVNIKAHGLRDDIVLYNGKILDGRNRYLACKELRISPRYVEFDGNSPLEFVLSKNLHRRHLTESQRAMVASKLANLRDGQTAAKVAKNSELPPVTNKQAADMLKVGESTVRQARAVRAKGTPELVKAVEQGRVKVSKAAKIAALPKEKQADAVKAKKAEVAPKMTPPAAAGGPLTQWKDRVKNLAADLYFALNELHDLERRKPTARDIKNMRASISRLYKQVDKFDDYMDTIGAGQ